MELAAASGLERAYVIAATLRAVVEGELGLVEQMTQTAATALARPTGCRTSTRWSSWRR